jgi:hypothetical protein
MIYCALFLFLNESDGLHGYVDLEIMSFIWVEPGRRRPSFVAFVLGWPIYTPHPLKNKILSPFPN